MPPRRASLRHPFSLIISIGWPDGVVTREEVARFAARDTALMAARRATTAWSQMLGGAHWPPTYTVVDARDGTEYPISTPIERGNSHATQDNQFRPGRLY